MRILRLLAGLLAVVLTGCTQLPTSGPVVEVSVSSQGRGVRIAPEPPVAGMSQARVVEGFLQAMADPTGDYAVARQYLTAATADAWEPTARTMIYDGVLLDSEGQQVLEGTIRGQLDPVGRFRGGNEGLSHDFQVVQEEGEWRIGAAPEGVLLSSYIFNRSYTVVKSYFMARGGQTVIADLIHIPVLELTPERVLRAQFAGPSQELAQITHSALPEGVTPGGGASVDTEGTVLVDLQGLPDNLPDGARRALGAQLLWSLASIPRVSGLRVTVGGTPWVIPGQNAEGVLELSSQQGYQPLSRASAVDLIGVRESRLGRLSPERNFIPLGGDGNPLDLAAVSLDGSTVAHVTAATGEARIGPMNGALSTVDSTVRNVASIQFAGGRLWLLGQDETGAQRLVSLSSQGEISVVDTSTVPGGIVDLAVDPSGTRAGLLVELEGEVQLGIAMLDGVQRLLPWQPLSPVADTGTVLTDFVALDWTGEIALAVIARSDAEGSVFVVRSDGSQVNDIGPTVGEPVSLTALPRPGGDSVAIRYDSGEVMVYSANRNWQPANALFDWISYPG